MANKATGVGLEIPDDIVTTLNLIDNKVFSLIRNLPAMGKDFKDAFDVTAQAKTLNHLSMMEKKMGSTSAAAQALSRNFAKAFQGEDGKTANIVAILRGIGKSLEDINSKTAGVSQLGGSFQQAAVPAAQIQGELVGVVNLLQSISAAKPFADWDLTGVAGQIKNLNEMLAQTASIVDGSKGASKMLDIAKIKARTDEIDKKMLLNKERAAQKADEIDRRTAMANQQHYNRMELQAERHNDRLREIEERGAQTRETLNARAEAEKNRVNAIVEAKAQITKLNHEKESLSKSTDPKDLARIKEINVELAKQQAIIDETTKAHNRLRGSKSHLFSISGQLARQLSLVFSVSQIEGYITKMAKVRGEMELQQRSLEAILQNKTKADEIFNKTVQSALKSPFRIQQLVTYTKQLAAYRVESDKLFDTTKRLADVSAGLGVDMQRLILAYGQVKAAAYLRGTEVRQFTEAGINLYGELQKLFKERDQADYTTAQIVDMISKRKVVFEDIEEVFKRLTAEGGLFYNMQEIQSETLQGKIGKLQDAIDMMYNNMGKANDGILKGGVDLLIALVKNWELLSVVIKAAVAALVTFQTVSVIGNIIAGTSKLITLWRHVSSAIEMAGLSIKKANRAMVGFDAAAAASGWAILASIVISTGVAIWQAYSNARREQEEYNKTVNEAVTTASQSSAEFKHLANVITDGTKSSAEQREALEKLKRKYSDIIPLQKDTVEWLKEMKGSYEGVTAAIYAKIEAQTQEKLAAATETKYGENIVNQTKKVVDLLKAAGLSDEAARTIAAKLREEIDSGAIKSVERFNERLSEMATEAKGATVSLDRFWSYMSSGGKVRINSITYINDAVTDLFNTLSNFKSELDANKSFELLPDIEGYDTAYAKKIRNILGKMEKEIQTFKENNKDKMNLFDLDERVKAKTIKAYSDYAQQLKKALESDEYTNAEKTYVQKTIENLENKINELDGTALQKKIRGLAEAAADVNKVALSSVKDVLVKSEEGLKEYGKRLKELIDDLKTEIAGLEFVVALDERGRADLQSYKDTLTVAESIWNQLPAWIKDKGKGAAKPEREIWQERIRVMQDMQARYEKLAQYQAPQEAIQKTQEAFKDAWKFVGMDSVMKAEDFLPTKKGLIEAYEKLLKDLPKGAKYTKIRAEIERSKGELEIGIDQDKLKEDLDEAKKQVEAAFAGKELYDKFRGMGLPASEISKLPIFNDMKTTWEQVYAEIEKQRKAGKLGDKEYEENIRKAQEGQHKELQQQMEEVVKNYRTQLSDQLQLDRWYYEERAKIYAQDKDGNFIFDERQRKEYEANLKRQYDQKSAKNKWDAFRNSESYISMFDNMDAYSTRALKRMRDEIASMKDSLKGLSPSELKAMVEAMNKLDDVVNKRNPFKTFAVSLRKYNQEARQMKKDDVLGKLDASNERVKALEDEARLKEDVLQKEEQKYETIQKSGKASDEEMQLQLDIIDANKREVDAVNAKLEHEKQVNKTLNDQVTAHNNTRKALIGSAEQIKNTIGTSASCIRQFSDILATAGVTVNNYTQQLIDANEEIGQNVGGIIQGMYSKNYGQAAVSTLGAIAGTVKLVMAGDAKLQDSIENHIKAIEILNSQYNRLKENMEKAYDVSALTNTSAAAELKLQAQIANYKSAINLERDKKKSNSSAIAEYQEQIAKLNQQLEELYQARLKALGGIGDDAKATAQDFVDAWIDAFRESGNTMDALTGKFDDMIENMVKKQAMMRVASKFLQPLMDLIDQSIGNDYIIDKEELSAITALANDPEKGLPAFNDVLRTLMESIGYPSKGSGGLSALTQSIQGVTESTAEALESLLNSMRYHVAQQSSDVAAIRAALERQYSDYENPMVTELRAQTGYLRSLNTSFQEVFTRSGNSKGAGLRVFIQ